MRRLLVLVSGLALATGFVPAAAVSAAPAQTTIAMNVTGCNGCTITPSQYRKGMKTPFSGKAAKVANGVATLVVPTANTNGMYFSIEAPWKVEINAQPLITVQYKGYAAGSTVTRAQAMASKSASACWAGTTDATASIDVTVKRVLMPAFPPNAHHKTSVPLAYFAPTAVAPGGFSKPYKGVLATQDVWTCP